MEPTVGTIDSITLPTPFGVPNEAVAGAYTRSSYDPDYLENQFSDIDRATADHYGKSFYAATQNGTLMVYDPLTGQERFVSTNMPSDPNDPTRKNNMYPSINPSKTN